MQVVRRVGGTWYGHRLILFGFLSQSSKTKAVAAMPSVAHARTAGPGDTPAGQGDLAGFRREFYASLTARADALFELTDAVLCADGPVTSLVELTLVAEHRRGHGAMYDALNRGPGRARSGCVGRWHRLPLPRAADGRIVLAVDVSPWLRPDAADQRGPAVLPRLRPGKGQRPADPGLAVLVRRRPGDRAARSWTAVLDAVRLGPADDATAVTAAQLRDVVDRLITAGHWQPGDPHDPDRGRRRLRHHPAGLRAGRPARGAGRTAALGPGPAPAQAAPAARAATGRPPKHGPEIALDKPGHLADPAAHHQHRHHPLRHRDRDQLGPGAPPADPPRLLDRPRRRAARSSRAP